MTEPTHSEPQAERRDDGTIVEPENSTVDDWFGQNAARDQELAEQVAEAEPTLDDAEARYEELHEGEERYREGHPRPQEGRDEERLADSPGATLDDDEIAEPNEPA